MAVNPFEESADTVNGRLTNIQLDIRELTTNFKNFNSNFERINTDINEIKKATNKAVETATETKTAYVQLTGKVEVSDKEIASVKVFVTSEILGMKTDQKERAKESKADRKWLIGTIIVVIGLIANNIIKFY